MFFMTRRYYRLANVIMKRPTQQFNDETPQAKNALLLTDYGYQIVMKQVKLSSKVSIDHPWNVFFITTSLVQIHVTPISCTCGFLQPNFLPYRHIFALHIELGLDVYFEEGVPSHWLMAQYKSEHASLYENSHCDDSDITNQTSKPIPTQAQNIRQHLWLVRS